MKSVANGNKLSPVVKVSEDEATDGSQQYCVNFVGNYLWFGIGAAHQRESPYAGPVRAPSSLFPFHPAYSPGSILMAAI
jgi:hypothetical protein